MSKTVKGVLENEKVWYVYMVECNDNTIYTGITNNLLKRVTAHNKGKGAKYTKNRLPVVLRAYWTCVDKSEAAKLEYSFKKLTRVAKLELIRSWC